MRISSLVLSCLGLSMACTHVCAENNAFSFIGKLSTLGLTAEMAYAKSEYTELFSNISGFNYDKDLTAGGSDYNANLRLMSLIAGLRYYPSASNLYVGGGFGINNNEIVLTPQLSNGEFVFNGIRYDTNEVSNSEMRAVYNTFAPMLMVGWQSKKINETGLSFFGEAGVFYNGDTEVESNSPCSTLSARCTQLKNDYEKARAQVEAKLDDFVVYPVLSLGVRYSF